jgi:hypothetical protein
MEIELQFQMNVINSKIYIIKDDLTINLSDTLNIQSKDIVRIKEDIIERFFPSIYNRNTIYLCYIKTDKDYYTDQLKFSDKYICNKSLIIIENYDSLNINIDNVKLYFTLYKYSDVSILNRYPKYQINLNLLLKYKLLDRKRLLLFTFSKKSFINKNINQNHHIFKYINIITNNGQKGNMLCDCIITEKYEHYFIRKINILDTELIYINENNISKKFDTDIISKFYFSYTYDNIKNIFDKLNKLNIDIYIDDKTDIIYYKVFDIYKCIKKNDSNNHKI